MANLRRQATMPQRLLGMAPDGNVFPFAENRCVFEKLYGRAEAAMDCGLDPVGGSRSADQRNFSIGATFRHER